jgi:putative MATE family efflux protein
LDDRTKSLLNDPPLPLLVAMATPNSLAFLVQSGVSLTEVWFIGQLGSTSLAAIALVFPLLMLTQTLSGGALGGAITSSVARSLGAGDVGRAERLLWHALVIAAGGALLLLALFLLIGRPFLEFLGGKGEVLSQAVSYCLVLFPAGIFIWLVGAVSAIYRGTGNMKFPASLMILGAVFQVPLSGCLVLGAFGFPQLGVTGAAISATVSACIVSCVMIFRLTARNTPVRLKASEFKLSGSLFRDILKVALPAALSPLLTVSTIIILTAIVGSFGQSALAGYGIGSRIEFLLIPLVFGLGAAMTSMVGMNIGANNQARAERIGWIGGIGAAILAGSIGLVLAIFASSWIPLFSDDPAAIESATSYIRIVGPCFALHGLGLSLYFASQGAGVMFWAITATVVRILLAAGGAACLVFMLGTGLEGVFIAAAAGMIVYGTMIALSLKLGAWRR